MTKFGAWRAPLSVPDRQQPDRSRRHLSGEGPGSGRREVRGVSGKSGPIAAGTENDPERMTGRHAGGVGGRRTDGEARDAEGQRRAAELLLGAGADLNWEPDYGEGTPLDAATGLGTRQENVIQWLRFIGARSGTSPT